ncbi:hypothetical protein NHX12_032715 [Muraenolepis orangiensis]|uniref:PH domain-containing protein n=1 Tax=Muraenolepis orangiensis TaxID=630683 RepID=A0A9Q0E8D7_9TELE|nr:hypothetical protein NHX12_032715 [Muraenolepis orangiensis]
MAATGLYPLEVKAAEGRTVEPEAIGLMKDDQLGVGTDTEPLGPDQPSPGNRLQCQPAVSRGRSSSAGTGIKPAARCRGTASASPNRQRLANDHSDPNQTQKAMGLEPGYPTATDTKQKGDLSESRMGRSDTRANKQEKMQPCEDVTHTPVPERRAKSLERRTSESIMTPDLLNFKKGWMVKLEKEDQAFDLQGEIDLSKCYDVSEYPVLRNYGFQIHTQRGVYTLSAMTAGIRKNWIQALMKNVNRANAPDVASFPGHHIPGEPLPKPDVTRDSPSKVPTEEAPHLNGHPKTLQERRTDEDGETSDWTEFRPLSEPRGKVAGRWTPEEVERSAFRAEKAVPLFTEAAAKDAADLQRLMETYRQGTDSTPRSEMEGDPLGTCDTVPLNGHAQNLRDMYWETRCLLQQQNAIRQSMQEQLATSLSPLEREGSPRFQTPSIWLHDTDGNQQELGYFHPNFPSTLNTTTPPLVSDDEEPLPHYEKEFGSNIQTHLGMATYEQVSSSDTHLNITTWIGKDMGEDYKQTPNIFQSLSDQGERVAPRLAVFERLTQEVELLTGQNKALHQHNQEMLNQLTEADREIERLKVDLGHLPEMERMSQTRVAFLEMELNSRHQELLKAKSLSASLEQRLSEVESQAPQLGITDLQALDTAEDTNESGVEVDGMTANHSRKGYLLRCFEATEAKLIDLERELQQSEQSCSELRFRNVAMVEAGMTCSWRRAEAEAEVTRLSAELAKEKSREGPKIPNEENFLQVSEGTGTPSKAQGKLRQVIGRSDLTLMEIEREERNMRNMNKAESTQTTEDKRICVLLIEVAEHMMVERQLLLLAQDLLSASCTSVGRANLVEIDEGMHSNGTGNLASAKPESENWSDFTDTQDLNNQQFCKVKRIGNDFKESKQKMYLLNYIASVTTSSTGNKLKLMGHRLCTYYPSRHRWLHTIHNAAADAWHRLLIGGELNETQPEGRLTSPTCTNCRSLRRENRELMAKVSLLEKELEKASAGSKTPSTNLQGQDEESQTPSIWLHDTKGDQHMLKNSDPEDPSMPYVNTPPPVSDHQDQLLQNESRRGRPNQGDVTTSTLTQGDREVEICNHGRDGCLDEEEEEEEDEEEKEEEEEEEEEKWGEEEEEEEGRVARLRGQVKELEEQLCLVAEELKAEHDGSMSALRLQHENDIERLKEACERGLASIEESQQQVLERIQLHHRGELERLLTDRDQLLEEETAATVTAIESIKRAYQLQLDRQAEKTHGSKISTDNTHLQETHRQHREELEVLAQQYSLQRLENGHLGQALDAERTALCQCQQENQALRARNQELSGLLAAELSRLCSRSQRELSPLRQGAGAYQLEISLRVKESKIQCLRQEVTSLKDELLHAHKDRSLAVERQTEISTELSVSKVRFQRDVDVLRENLRLAHRALEQTIP